MVTFTVTFSLPPLKEGKPASFINVLLTVVWGGGHLNFSTASPEKPEPPTCSLRVVAESPMMLLSSPWDPDVSVKCRGHNSKMSSSRQTGTLASLRDTEEEFRQPLLGRGAKRLFVSSVTFAFLLLLNSRIFSELCSPCLPEIEMFSSILSSKHAGIPPLLMVVFPLPLKHHSTHSAFLNIGVWGKIPTISLISFRPFSFTAELCGFFFGQAEQEAHLEGSGRFWC